MCFGRALRTPLADCIRFRGSWLRRLEDTNVLQMGLFGPPSWSLAGQAALKKARPPPAAQYSHLVLVAGHSVFIGSNASEPHSQESWFLQPYQHVPGVVDSFLEHIHLGIEAAAKDPAAVLVFSGGYTRDEAGSRSEGGSYWAVANGLRWFGNEHVKARAIIEDRARDSFENLLFGVCRFTQFAGRYPTRITIVSYDVKRHRFVHLHAAALGFSEDKIEFIGTPVINSLELAEKGERETVDAFLADPYGCKDPLKSKRASRDPFGFQGNQDVAHCPALRPFLLGCPTSLYKGALPWRSGNRFRLDAANIMGLNGLGV